MRNLRRSVLSGALVLVAANVMAQEETNDGTLAQYIARTHEVSTFGKLVEDAGLLQQLTSAGPYTLFVPSNDAFERLEAGKLNALRNDREGLRRLLLYHGVPSSVDSSTLGANREMETLIGPTGPKLHAVMKDGRMLVNGKAIATTTNIRVGNGTIHIIDTVLTPPIPTTGADGGGG
ncbi:MAG: fasciclin domain-containing protein [Fimbriimonadaceae bacterium]|nr:fasciclin domain-containing protein [Fimbriimonadaceae bacterium]QYK54897.1 MAG: fasciclin domain-containing protein [Fimbriimonadaceae bacterium]